MSIIVSESYLSRPFKLGTTQGSGRELIFNILGTDDETEVQTAFLAAIPSVYGTLALESVEVEPVEVDSVAGVGNWKGVARYAREEDSNEFTFDTGGGTVKMTQSLATINSYSPGPLPPPDFGGAINVSEDAVAGVDVASPSWNHTETYSFTDAQVDSTYRRNLFLLTGCWNDAPFKGFESGECMFMGATGRRGSSLLPKPWQITFRFAGSPNATGLMVGSIGPIDKLGFDYLWVLYRDFEDGSASDLVKKPVAVYVERVSSPGDFSLLNIGT
jgi:hypothetical protein